MGLCSYCRLKCLNIKGMIYAVKCPLSCIECDCISYFYTLFMYWLEYSKLIKYASYYYKIKLLNTYDMKISYLQGVKLLKYIYDTEIVRVQHICCGYIIVELLGRMPLSCAKCDIIKFCDYMLSDIFLLHITVLEMIKSIVYVMFGEIVFCMHVWNQLNIVCIICSMLCKCTVQIKLNARHHRLNQNKEMVRCSIWNNLRDLEDLNHVSGLPFSCMKCVTDIEFNIIKDSCHEATVVNADLVSYIYYRWLNIYNGITHSCKKLDQMGQVVIALIHSNG